MGAMHVLDTAALTPPVRKSTAKEEADRFFPLGGGVEGRAASTMGIVSGGEPESLILTADIISLQW